MSYSLADLEGRRANVQAPIAPLGDMRSGSIGKGTRAAGAVASAGIEEPRVGDFVGEAVNQQGAGQEAGGVLSGAGGVVSVGVLIRPGAETSRRGAKRSGWPRGERICLETAYTGSRRQSCTSIWTPPKTGNGGARAS